MIYCQEISPVSTWKWVTGKSSCPCYLWNGLKVWFSRNLWLTTQTSKYSRLIKKIQRTQRCIDVNKVFINIKYSFTFTFSHFTKLELSLLQGRGFSVQAPVGTKFGTCFVTRRRCQDTFRELPRYPWARYLLLKWWHMALALVMHSGVPCLSPQWDGMGLSTLPVIPKRDIPANKKQRKQSEKKTWNLCFTWNS